MPIDVEDWPRLERPVLVMALSGWVDAGLAGAGAASILSEQMESSRRFGRIDLSEDVDLQQTRPSVSLVGGETRMITWPTIDLVAGRARRDLVLVTGPEPSVRWRALCAELVDASKTLGVERAVMLGGMPAVVSHRRPVQVLATATSRSLAQESGALRSDYAGATGAQTVVQMALGEAGIPALGLWAQVPHYVSATASPPAISALLRRLGELTGVEAELGSLDAQADTYTKRVEDGLAERPDVAELVQAIEAGTTDVPTGDELASEIERYLRDQG